MSTEEHQEQLSARAMFELARWPIIVGLLAIAAILIVTTLAGQLG